MRIAMSLGLTLVVGMAAAARAEEEVPLEKLPKEVLDAVKAKFPDVKLLSAEKHKDKGKMVYWVETKVKDVNIDVTVTPEGKVVEIDREIAIKDIPAPVMAAVKKRFPKGTITESSEVSRDDKVVAYDIQVVTSTKRKYDLAYDPSSLPLGS
jgi:uncharacterized membrane protein YkoI